MAKLALRNKGGVPFLTLKGHFIVRAKQMPDGDTIHFAASKKYSSGLVETNIPVSSTGGKSVPLRLQSIDAPEKAQPLGAEARNGMLRHLGFDPTALGLGDDDFTADGPTAKVQGWVATHGMDGNGRPLSYVFRDNPGFTHGRVESASDITAVLKSSGNYLQVTKGWAFPAFYDNTDETHAVVFQAASEKARDSDEPVWDADVTTSGFVPTKSALGAGGVLIYPKFFRRVQGWKNAKPNAAAFIKWLQAQEDGKKLVQGALPSPIALWKLFEVVSATKVAVPYDVTKLWFSK